MLDETLTLEEADLQNAVIIQRLKKTLNLLNSFHSIDFLYTKWKVSPKMIVISGHANQNKGKPDLLGFALFSLLMRF